MRKKRHADYADAADFPQRVADQYPRNQRDLREQKNSTQMARNRFKIAAKTLRNHQFNMRIGGRSERESRLARVSAIYGRGLRYAEFLAQSTAVNCVTRNF